MGLFKSEAQKRFEHDQAVIQHHIAVGRDPDTARHGDDAQIADEGTYTKQEAEKLDRRHIKSMSNKNGKIVVIFKRGKKPV